MLNMEPVKAKVQQLPVHVHYNFFFGRRATWHVHWLYHVHL